MTTQVKRFTRDKNHYDAVLRNWFPRMSGNNKYVVGNIIGDAKERFADGDQIYTSNLLPGQKLVEGNIVYTRNSAYLLGKSNATYPDGGKIEDTTKIQLESLRNFMKFRGYSLVYTDYTVFWRWTFDDATDTGRDVIAFYKGVAAHNNAHDLAAGKLVSRVKLQKAGNRIFVQDHKVKYI